MPTKWYFHAAISGDTGTLPSTSSSPLATEVTAGTPTLLPTRFNNRSMDNVIGSSQTFAQLTTGASTSAQQYCCIRFISPPLAATTTPGGDTWAVHLAASESSANSNFNPNFFVGIWRPSTGALVGTVISSASAVAAGTVETAQTVSVTGIASHSCLDGDILIVEIWRTSSAQSMATAYTNIIYYDGTTEDSASSNAAYLLTPVDFPLQSGAAQIWQPPRRNVNQAVQRSSVW